MIKAQLFAMGTQRELVSTQLTYYKTVNAKTGRSGPIPMGGLVTLAFASGDGDDRLLRWITHHSEGELCTLTEARIVFYAGDPDGSTLFEYQLHDAALVHWKEEFKATGTTPMTVTITISAAIQTIKGITWIKTWRENRVLSEESTTHKEGVQRGVSHDRGKKEDGSVLESVVLEDAKSSSNLWKVGSYKDLRGLEAGLDAHHVGQRALMKRLVPGYNTGTAPSIFVPKAGHTVGPGVVSRSTAGFINVRQVLARDIFELRRVYGPQGIPNSSLQQLIHMNKRMYPGSFVK